MKGVYDVKIFTDEFTGSVRKIVKKKALIITASSLVGITAIGIGFRSAYLAGQNSVLPVSAFTENSSSTISISASSSLSDSNAVSASSSVQSASASASSTKTSSSSKRSNDFPTVATAPAAPSAAAPTPVTPTPIPEPTTPPPAATAPSASTPVTSTPVASSTPEFRLNQTTVPVLLKSMHKLKCCKHRSAPLKPSTPQQTFRACRPLLTTNAAANKLCSTLKYKLCESAMHTRVLYRMKQRITMLQQTMVTV